MDFLSRPFHIQFLLGELNRRKSDNPNYSLRAFARQLNVDPSALSRVLSGKQGLSLHQCRRVLTRLKLPGEVRAHFIHSIGEEKKRQVCQLLSSIPEQPARKART